VLPEREPDHTPRPDTGFGLRSFRIHRQRAQDVVEYGMIIATIAVVILLGVTTFGSQIKPWFEHLAAHITTVGT
jgi:Flp pilus assembly pilin Flp